MQRMRRRTRRRRRRRARRRGRQSRESSRSVEIRRILSIYLVETDNWEIKTLTHRFLQDANYFCRPNIPAPSSTVDRQLTELDLLFEQLTLEETEALRRDLESHPTRDRIARDVGLVIRRGALSAPAFTEFGPSEVVVAASAKVEHIKEEAVEGKEKEEERPWTTEELALLIKAVNKFPGGTVRRWEVIGEYVALHSGQPVRSQEELIRRSKEVRKGE